MTRLHYERAVKTPYELEPACAKRNEMGARGHRGRARGVSPRRL